ncbi:hypothetical protein DFH08DRAFT_416647 [Mycena albidolilacea]|uniref:Uncharacterized protein n=1 Tax=Mycena albidolilacea TaxID=1033008 RepID=A0AAD7AIQ8_9AGAR|nr:hypothetical protein DFH08DRAFT_416647 [Mycena albidolilacea]
MTSFFRAYNALLIRRPMAAQCGTAALLFGAGDIIAQQAVERKGKEHDFARTARLTFYGGAMFGPAMTKWYQLLNRIQFQTPTKAIVYRVWLDQCVLTPGAVIVFFGSMALLEGKPNDIVPRIGAGYVPTLLRNWAVFVPTQIINFWLVPPHLRFVVVSVVSLFWNTYLSVANSMAKKHGEAAIEEKRVEKIAE